MTPGSSDETNADAEWQPVWKALADAGVDERALESAAAEGRDGIVRMVVRYLMFPGARRYTAPELYAKSGVDEETATALWRAMGFPDVPDDDAAFTDADLEALQVATRLFDRAGMDRTIVLQQARTMSQAVARIAASHQDVITGIVPDSYAARETAEAVTLADETLPALDHLLVYMYRRHLAAATEQGLLTTTSDEGGVSMSVGFADLSRFTAMSQGLDVRELAGLIDRFNASTAEVVTQAGGRVIKTIGDEVMFATKDPGSAASIALNLIDTVSRADELPPLKVGVATGTVIAREGDIFGPPVNLAHRLVSTAKADSILVDEATQNALANDPRFQLSRLARLHLKGLGHVRSFRLRPADSGRPTKRR